MSLRLAVLKNVFDVYNTQAYSLIFFFVAVIYLIIKNSQKMKSPKFSKQNKNLLKFSAFVVLMCVDFLLKC